MVLITLLFLPLTAAFSVWFLISFVYYKFKVNKMMKNVEIHKGEIPIVGHALYFSYKKLENSKDFYQVIEEMSRGATHDKRLWILNYHFFMAIKLRTIEKILSSQETVEKSYLYNQLSVFLDGVLIAPIKKWRKLRKRLNSTFNPKFFPQYINQINYQTGILIRKFKNNENNEYDVLPHISKYLFDTVTSTHLGVNTKQQFNEGAYFAEDVSKSTEMVFKRMSQPWLHPDQLFHRSSLYQKVKKVLDSHKPFLEDLVIKSEECQHKTDLSGNLLGWKSYSYHCKEVLQEDGVKTSPSAVSHCISDLLIAESIP